MKLAEALQERAGLNKKIEELRSRIENCVLVQEGEEAGEDPAALLAELDDAVARLEILMAAINLTNSRTKVNGKSLTQIIARKDALNLQRGAYRSIYYAAAQKVTRAVMLPPVLLTYIRDNMEPYFKNQASFDDCCDDLLNVLEIYKDE